jgi:hypothetical protein
MKVEDEQREKARKPSDGCVINGDRQINVDYFCPR